MKMITELPPLFQSWFDRQGWTPRRHQLATVQAARDGVSALLIAPTGGGKTLAGFLPSLIDLAGDKDSSPHLHTLYISPLKALSNNVAQSLARPVAEMALPVRVEVRTGDTSASQRRRQQKTPPHILLTTPESLALLLSYPEAEAYFQSLKRLVIDEVHALAGTKRGDQLALCATRLYAMAPALQCCGLSATVAHPASMAAWVSPTGKASDVRTIIAEEGAAPDISLLMPDSGGYFPWSGHMGLGSASAILKAIQQARLTIVFVNSRAQAELLFQALWKENTDNLPIGLHHGSLDGAHRARIEEAMANSALRAVVATSSLDLGLDWGDVDQIIQVGAPKEVARLTQRIGRANHRMDEPSRALIAPANRWEVIECEAARDAVLQHDLDGEPPRAGTFDVLAQHILGTACAGPFDPEQLYEEVRRSAPYQNLSLQDFEDVLRFVEDGGYALRSYDRHRRLFRNDLGQIWVRNEKIIKQYRMNIGTIVDSPLLRVKTRQGKYCGEIDEFFASTLLPGDTFLLGGGLFEFLGMQDTNVQVAAGRGQNPRVPVYGGNRLSISSNLAKRVLTILSTRSLWSDLPETVQNWLQKQERYSRLPAPEGLLIETFAYKKRYYLICYAFEGRNAHQTLGMLLTNRLEQTGAAPLGFVANDYALACWSVHPPENIDGLFSEQLLGDNLQEWLDKSAMLRRTFREVALISGLVDRNLPGREKSRRQMTMSTDLLYDVLLKYDPDHILLRATRMQAAAGLTDLNRLSAMLRRVRGKLDIVRLPRISPFAVPLLLELGREKIKGGSGEEALLAEAEALFRLSEES